MNIFRQIKIIFPYLFLFSLFFPYSVFAKEQNIIDDNIIVSFPYHSDPNAKLKPPEPLLPAIRFLTSADFFPFNYRNNLGRLEGFNIDLSKEICAILNISCTIQDWPWEQIKEALNDNQGDAIIAGLAINKQSAQKFDFSDIYLMFPARFVSRKINIPTFNLDNLAGKKISIVANSVHEKFLTDYFPEIEQIKFPGEKQALKAMKDGVSYAYFGDALNASFWLNENINCCVFVGKSFFNSDYFGEGLAIATVKKNEKLRQTINYALYELKQNGKLDELYLRWFPISFY